MLTSYYAWVDFLHMGPTKEELKNLYLVEGKKDRQIANILGCTDVQVSKLRKKFNIKTLRQDERRVFEGYPSLSTLTKDVFEKLYNVEKKTFSSIGEIYGVHKPAVLELARKYGIDSIIKSDRTTETLTKVQREVLIGVLLGDGCIGYEKGSVTSRFTVSHSSKQYNYLLHTKKCLGSLVSSYGETSQFLDNGKKVHETKLRTYYHRELRELRNVFYRDDLYGKHPVDHLKAPPREIFRNLTWRSLAFWYFDDGTLSTDLPKIVIHFPLLEIGQIVEDIKFSTGLDWYSSPGRDENLYYLKLRVKDRKSFFDSILKYAPPDLKYKFPSNYHGLIPGEIKFSSFMGSYEEDKLSQYSVPVWKGLSVEDQDKWVNEVFDIYRKIGFPYVRTPGDSEILAVVDNVTNHGETVTEDYSFNRSQVGISLCNSFMPHRYETRVGGVTAYETFMDDSKFKKVIYTKFKLKNSDWVTPQAMRTALSIFGGNRTPSNFRPSTAKTIVDNLCPQKGVVWDPCAGFGGRLLGAVSSKKEVTYLCTEPSPQTVEGLENLWKSVLKVKGWDPDRVRITKGVAERNCPDSNSVDLVFTSPPYYTTEKYIGGEQSHYYGNYNDWVRLFLKPLTYNAYRCLKTGGYFAINIQKVKINKITYNLVEDLDRLALEAGFSRHDRWWYPLRRFIHQRPDEPILVYRKLDVFKEKYWDLNLEQVTKANLKFIIPYKCSKCSVVLPEALLGVKYCEDCAYDVQVLENSKLSKDFIAIQKSRREKEASLRAIEDRKMMVEARHARETQRVIERGRREREKLVKIRRQEEVRAEYLRQNPLPKYRTYKCDGCSVDLTVKIGEPVPKHCETCLKSFEKASKAARTKICKYRHCDREFYDETPNKVILYCHEEHARREGMFIKRRVEDVSDFRKPDPVLDAGKVVEKTHKCKVCKSEYIRKSQETRCAECTETARHKVCKKSHCDTKFRDDSSKNTQRFCEGCRDTKHKVISTKRVQQRGIDLRGEDPSLALERFKRETTNWWGLVGESLFYHLSKVSGGDEMETLVEARNGGGYAAVKITKVKPAPNGKHSWRADILGIKESCTGCFFVGLDSEKKKIDKTWWIPSEKLPNQLVVMTPESKEYQGGEFELTPTEIETLNAKLPELLVIGRSS